MLMGIFDLHFPHFNKIFCHVIHSPITRLLGSEGTLHYDMHPTRTHSVSLCCYWKATTIF